MHRGGRTIEGARLTVVVPFRDRSRHTLRFAEWANRQHYPFPIIFSDGSPGTELESVFADPGNFPNLDYRYLSLPGTVDIDGYMTRVLTAAEHIRTPYAVVNPNDDFFLVSALQAGVEFLDRHPEFTAVTGELVDFHTEHCPELGEWNTLYGRMVIPGKVFRARSYEQPNGPARMTDHILHMFNNGPVYSLCRTDTFRRMHAAARAMAAPDWHFADRALIFALLACGKVKGWGPIALHQANGNTAGLEMITRDRTWLGWVQRPEWKDAFGRLAEAVAAVVADVDGLAPADALDGLRDIIFAAVGKQIVEGFHPDLRVPPRDFDPAEFAALAALPEVKATVQFMIEGLARVRQQLAGNQPA